MELLSQFITHPDIINVMKTSNVTSLDQLVPRLFPFFRHAIKSVRSSVLKTVDILVDVGEALLSSKGANWLGAELLRLVFQNFLLEESPEIITQTLSVWKKLALFLAKIGNPVNKCLLN
jgi:TATA-binding protein-associated factor